MEFLLFSRSQLQYKYFYKNRYTIDYWLSSCVFPVDMQLYAQRLIGNAWHLADGNQTVGFSGTNDNHRFLPLQVRQYFPSDDDIRKDTVILNLFGTNGMMIESIRKNTIACIKFDELTDVLIVIYKQNCRTIIDCGALLAGVNLSKFAKDIFEIVQDRDFSGVLYFDSLVGSWMILERNGRIRTMKRSPVTVLECFVVFDEPHCRGCDFQLPSNAIALLTLGPNITKDKFMQGAGRMRKLDMGQQLVIAGGSDIFGQIQDLAGKSAKDIVNSIDVLRWVMQNTINENEKSLIPWSKQGFLFASSKKNVKYSVEDECKSLRDFYGHAVCSSTASVRVEKVSLSIKITECKSDSHMGKMVKDIVDLSKKFGSDFNCSVDINADEECEREFEQEEEEEEEEEVRLSSMLIPIILMFVCLHRNRLRFRH